MSSPNPIQPLNLGNVVSAGLRLYRSNFKAYLKIAIAATLWLLLPSAGLIVLGIGLAAFFPPLIVLLVLVAIPIYIYCSAKYTAYAGVISRLAFGELINQPESVSTASAQVLPRMWTLWAAGFLVGLIAFGVSLAFSVVSTILSVAAAAGGSAEAGGLILLLLVNVLQLVSVGVQFWINARFFIFSLPILVEENVNATKAIGRSWNLTQGNAFRVMLILLVTFLVTSPLFTLVTFAAVAIGLPLFRATPDTANEVLLFALPLILVISALFLLSFMLVMPLWEAIRAVIYYDLRSRREGLGLQLRDRDTPI